MTPENTISGLSTTELTTTLISLHYQGKLFWFHDFISSRLVAEGKTYEEGEGLVEVFWSLKNLQSALADYS